MFIKRFKDYVCFKFDENVHKYKVRVTLVKFSYDNEKLIIHYTLKEKYKMSVDHFTLEDTIQKGLYFDQIDLKKIYGVQAVINLLQKHECKELSINTYISEVNDELGI